MINMRALRQTGHCLRGKSSLASRVSTRTFASQTDLLGATLQNGDPEIHAILKRVSITTNLN
ncbi:hypothetical protein FSOLCH5_004001 [Fusarium solani]